MEEVSHYEKYKSVENRVSSSYEALEVCETGVREGTTATSNANNVDTNSNPRHLKKRFCCGITAAAVAVTIIALAVMLAVLKSKDGNYCTGNACLHGECVDGIGNYSCSCYPGFEGTRCEKYTNNCMSNPCIHGHCFNGLDTYRCLCYQGYTGQSCDININECLTNPCIYGNCTDEVNGYNCSCIAGYTGRNCEQYDNYCTQNACLHGECFEGIGNYNCSCYLGFEGTRCEKYTNKCMSNPCLHGHCFNGLDTYKCLCYQGYTGQSCDININECLTNPCKNGNCTDGINGYNCSCLAGYTGINCEHLKVSDCYDIGSIGVSSSGIYTVQLWKSKQLIQVYCDMDTDGGGWTVFQYRFNGSTDFYRNFSEYENEFGSLSAEFWLGLKYVQEMTDQGKSELRLDLEAADGTTAYETFQNFSLGKPTGYTLNIDKGFGTAGDTYGLSHNNGYHFSTYDADRDGTSGNCAIQNHGGWWYYSCAYANLNGEYVTPGTVGPGGGWRGMYYYSFRQLESLKSSKMMFRRV